MEFPTTINRSSPFPNKGVLGVFLCVFFSLNFNRGFCKQTVKFLIIMRCLIWICTVCLCPTKRTLGLYGITCYCIGMFLAHLSQRLMGELIVYQSLRRPSVRPSSVRPSSVRPSVCQHFQTSSPLKPLGQINSNLIWRLLRMRKRKFVQMVLVT